MDKKESLKEEKILEEGKPKTIIFEVGINGVPKLDIRCEDDDITEIDVATALAGIDLLLFNQKYKKNKLYEEYLMFNTLRKELFLNYVAKLYSDDENLEKLLDILSEVI